MHKKIPKKQDCKSSFLEWSARALPRGSRGRAAPLLKNLSKISSEILLHISTGEIEVENLLTGIAVLCGKDISAVLAKTNAVTIAVGGDCKHI